LDSDNFLGCIPSVDTNRTEYEQHIDISSPASVKEQVEVEQDGMLHIEGNSHDWDDNRSTCVADQEIQAEGCLLLEAHAHHEGNITGHLARKDKEHSAGRYNEDDHSLSGDMDSELKLEQPHERVYSDFWTKGKADEDVGTHISKFLIEFKHNNSIIFSAL
jgi:hypothetical protein